MMDDDDDDGSIAPDPSAGRAETQELLYLDGGRGKYLPGLLSVPLDFLKVLSSSLLRLSFLFFLLSSGVVLFLELEFELNRQRSAWLKNKVSFPSFLLTFLFFIIFPLHPNLCFKCTIPWN